MTARQATDIVSFYRELASYPTPTRAEILSSGDGKTLLVQSTWSQRDVDRKEKTTFLRWHTIAAQTGDVLAKTAPQEVKNELWNKLSPSGNLRAVVLAQKDKKNEDKQYLEIFDTNRKLKTIDVLALEKHGKIIGNDGQFGSLEWSASEGHLLYMAEKKRASTGSLFDPKAVKDLLGGGDDDVMDSGKEHLTRGDEFVHVENWGEQMTERVCPVVCILDIEANTVSVLESLPEDVSPGQAMLAPDDAGVVVCAWNHEPFRLGLKFCFQRKSFLYYLDIQKNSFEMLSEEGWAVRCPRFSPDLNKLVYLDMPVGGAHNQCARLIQISWPGRERRVLVDQVGYTPDPEFPGIYTSGLSRNVWFDDSIHLALDTSWRSYSAVIVVNTETGKVQRLRTGSQDNSLGLLCVKGHDLLVTCSSLNQPFHLLLARIPNLDDVSSCVIFYLDDPSEAFEWLTWQVVHHKPSKEREHPKFSNLTYESILCLPVGAEPTELPPVIVFPHGGPNVAFDTSFNIITTFFVRCGYAVLMVNYRGSTGFGQNSILSLTGTIGTQDVKDVESAVVELLAKGVADGNRVLVFGGSHGGFLTTHLIGQYPDTFRAAATRNPVVNLVSMFSTTDIHDWIFAQTGLPFDYLSLADDTHLNYLWSCSPLSYVDQVKTPILLALGLDDKRVPPSQGLEYVRALKARHVPVRYYKRGKISSRYNKCQFGEITNLLKKMSQNILAQTDRLGMLQAYPGSNHSIEEVEAEADLMVNTVIWFGSHI